MEYIENGQFINKRKKMVVNQILSRNIINKDLIEAMLKVPRHMFVPEKIMEYAYENRPLPIGYEQTISQPYIVAIMTEQLDPKPGEKILEIGTGSGYQAAILDKMGCRVYTIEIIEPLGKRTRMNLISLGFDKINCKIGDGYKGWNEYAPFDKIIITASLDKVPQALIDQLVLNGKMIMPVKNGHQELKLITKTESGLLTKDIGPVLFVPMTGEIQDNK